MTTEIKGGDPHELSTDINVITAEINAYQRVAGEAIFEIGKRLKSVRENPAKYGFEGYRDWERWCAEQCGFSRRYANQFIKVYDEFGEDVLPKKGLQAMYEIATMPEETRTEPHTIPSTGAEKTVDEMTVRELREVKSELKKTQAERDAERKQREQAEAQAETAHRSEEILRRQLEEFDEREPTVEIRTEYVEVIKEDESAKARLAQYEEKFGAIENYSGAETSSNLASVTTAVMAFSKEVRELVKRHAFLMKYRESVGLLDPITKREYNETVKVLQELAHDFQMADIRTDIIDAKYTDIN